MRFEILVCTVALAVGCSDSGSEDTGPMFGGSAGGDANNGLAGNAGNAGNTASMPVTSTNGAGTGAAPTAGTGAAGSGTTPQTDPGGAMDPATPGSDTTTPAGSSSETPDAGSPGTTDPPEGGETTPDAALPEEPEPQNCDAATGTPGRTVEMVDHAGVTRRYILHVPDSYTGEQPVPLMVNFHPLLTDGAAAERSSGYRELADREGFIVAFPDGQESAAWNVGPCCTQSRDVDDVGFTRALVAQVQSEYCVDEKRIYASGFSMGGGMAHYVACEAADLFAAAAPGAFDLFEENTCDPVRPITVISFRSMSDVIVPYEGARMESAPNGFRGTHTFMGAVDTFEHWAEINGCTGQPVDEGGGCQTYKECEEGTEVTLCTVSGGHTWPDAERAWETLSRFTLP